MSNLVIVIGLKTPLLMVLEKGLIVFEIIFVYINEIFIQKKKKKKHQQMVVSGYDNL